MGFRLLLITIVAAALCLLTTVTLFLLARASEWQRASTSRSPFRWPIFAARTVVASFMVSVLYFLAVYAFGYLGYLGPLNLIPGLGIPVLVGLLEYPRPAGALLGIPLAITGFLCTALISLTVGIALD
jgi:hypothetical protein